MERTEVVPYLLQKANRGRLDYFCDMAVVVENIEDEAVQKEIRDILKDVYRKTYLVRKIAGRVFEM